jgi:hypothetical protein
MVEYKSRTFSDNLQYPGEDEYEGVIAAKTDMDFGAFSPGRAAILCAMSFSGDVCSVSTYSGVTEFPASAVSEILEHWLDVTAAAKAKLDDTTEPKAEGKLREHGDGTGW